VNNTFKATYSSWLKTHDKSHIEYQRRKRYPWHIIGGITFSEELIGSIQKIYNKSEVLLGEALITNITKRPDENKIQFDFELQNEIIKDKFCIVFLSSGLLITIFDLGKDIEKETIKKYLKGDTTKPYSRKISKLILLEFVWRKLKGLKLYEKYKNFDKIENDNIKSKLKLKNSFIVDISNERKFWIFVSLFEYEANPIEIRYSNQCEKIISLFLIKSKNIPNRSPNQDNILSVSEYFKNSLQKKEIELLKKLEQDVFEYAKFK
jgi:hypothetical protein